MRSLMALALTLSACGGDGGGSTPPLPDADPAAPMCTGDVYDNCTDAAQCSSNNCKLFSQDAIQVCTQACDGANPCPMDAAGTIGECNSRGICKPSRANACRP